MAFRKVHYTISYSHPKLVVKNYFSNTAAQKFKELSTIFKDLPCFRALSRALNFKNRIQALSRIFQALYEACLQPFTQHRPRRRRRFGRDVRFVEIQLKLTHLEHILGHASVVLESDGPTQNQR